MIDNFAVIGEKRFGKRLAGILVKDLKCFTPRVFLRAAYLAEI